MKINSRTKFIHASDIHLGSHQYKKSPRSDDSIKALKEILHLALDHTVDFLLLGGDVFNSLEILPSKMINIIEYLKEFHRATDGKVPIIAIEGNHDIRRHSRGVKFKHRGQSWLKVCAKLGLIVLLDANLQADSNNVFQPYDYEQGRGGKLRIKNTVVYGSRYLGEKPISALSVIRKAIKKERGTFNILLQHFGVDGQMRNVPGVSLNFLSPLHHRVDYLALGHFHKQFVIDDWIYNPGSAESICSMDFLFRRGIFLVEVSGVEKFEKKIQPIRLNNRIHLWKTVILPYQFKKKADLYSYIIKSLKKSHDWNFFKTNQVANETVPYLFLNLSGKQPFVYQDISPKNLESMLIENLPIAGVKLYQKFNSKISTIEVYL